ncbi:hypothetical protein QRO11_10045 [Paracidovorax citrulli]|uniref:hypothetical protein n=1 Tax=Paracidovorax citrulli TaxID=80869 RepID=UPI00255CD118|nr:hypothetical protein [Paracidovorax citrulli]WIY36633.1 hypothetical protein QRO11_10045 [Paracidovorax citrulli]
MSSMHVYSFDNGIPIQALLIYIDGLTLERLKIKGQYRIKISQDDSTLLVIKKSKYIAAIVGDRCHAIFTVDKWVLSCGAESSALAECGYFIDVAPDSKFAEFQFSPYNEYHISPRMLEFEGYVRGNQDRTRKIPAPPDEPMNMEKCIDAISTYYAVEPYQITINITNRDRIIHHKKVSTGDADDKR